MTSLNRTLEFLRLLFDSSEVSNVRVSGDAIEVRGVIGDIVESILSLPLSDSLLSEELPSGMAISLSEVTALECLRGTWSNTRSRRIYKNESKIHHSYGRLM